MSEQNGHAVSGGATANGDGRRGASGERKALAAGKRRPAGRKAAADTSAAGIVDAGQQRTVGVIKLAVMAYFLTCGGPFGIEDAVGACGPLITLAAFLLLPVVWALPQALMTAELATLMPVNGGSVLWVQRAFGNLAGWMNAWNNATGALFDLALYPVLVDDYVRASLSATVGELHPVAHFGIKLFTIAVVMALNLFGLDVVSWLAVVLLINIMAPFVVMAGMLPFAAPAPQFDRLGDVPNSEQFNAQLALSTLLWSFTGWDTLGAVAGEVRDPQRTFPRGVSIAVVGGVLNFAVPIVSAYSLSPGVERWTDGYFATAGESIGPWLTHWIVFASIVSNVGQLNAQMAVASRALWAMATGAGIGRKLPATCASEWSRFGTPAFAIAVVGLSTAALCNLTFQQLVSLEMAFVCVQLFMEFAAFLWLKHTDTSPRPYAVPGGKVGAWLITLPKALLVVVSLVFASWPIWVALFTGNALFLLGYFLFTCAYGRSPRMRRFMNAEPFGAAAGGAAAAAAVARPTRSRAHGADYDGLVDAVDLDDEDDDGGGGDSDADERNGGSICDTNGAANGHRRHDYGDDDASIDVDAAASNDDNDGDDVRPTDVLV